MIDDIQRFEFLGREFEEYMKSVSANTITIEVINEEEVIPNPNLPEQ